MKFDDIGPRFTVTLANTVGVLYRGLFYKATVLNEKNLKRPCNSCFFMPDTLESRQKTFFYQNLACIRLPPHNAGIVTR